MPRRWSHSQGVGRRAESLADVLGSDAEMLAAAAWVHDIGYAPGLASTGLHPLDGGRYLRDVEQAHPRICSLVANHSCAQVEAEYRGYGRELADEFPPVEGLLQDALTFCDLTITPDGEVTTADARLAELFRRYGEGTVLHEVLKDLGPLLIESAGRFSEVLRTAQGQFVGRTG